MSVILACEDCDTECNAGTAINHARPTVKYSLFVGMKLNLYFLKCFSNMFLNHASKVVVVKEVSIHIKMAFR